MQAWSNDRWMQIIYKNSFIGIWMNDKFQTLNNCFYYER